MTTGDEAPHEKRTGTPELVLGLCDLLGAKLVAYLASVPDTRTVRKWADPAGTPTPSDQIVERLQTAYRIATLLHEKDSADVVQAWFQGRNPLLNEIAPARLLRDGDVGTAGPLVLGAARAFAASLEKPRVDGAQRG